MTDIKSKTLNFKLNPKQLEFYHLKNRFSVMAGGVGAGKSFICVLRALKLIFDNPGIFGIIGAATFPQVRDTIMSDFDEMCPDEIIKNHNQATHTYRFINGAKLIFRPYEKARKLKSYTLGFAIIEEMTDVKYDIFTMLDSRLRQENMPCELFGATNADNLQNWVYKDFIDNPIEDSRIISSKTTDNRLHLPDKYIKSMKRMETTNLPFYRRMVEGIWGNLEGLVYDLPRSLVLPELQKGETYERGKHMPRQYQRIISGLDFGYEHPLGFLQIGVIDDEYYVFEEFKKKHLTSGDIEDVLKLSFEKNKSDAIYCDSSRPEIIEDLRRAGFPARKSRKDVFLGIMHIKTLIGKKKIFISSKLLRLIKEFDSYSWDGKSNKEIPIKLMDDLLDALRYALYSDKKLNSNTNKSKRLSWA